MGIIDFFKKGEKVNKNDLEQATPTITGVRNVWGDEDIVSGLTPERLADILRSAKQGGTESYLKLAEEMEEKDLHYRGVLGTRKSGVTSLDPVVTPGNDDKTGLDITESVQNEIIKHPQFPDLLKNALDALGKGYSVNEIIWDTSEKMWVPKQFCYRDPAWFKYDEETGQTLMLRSSNGVELEPLQPFKFIIHEPLLKSGLTIRGGIAMVVAFYFLIKNYNVKSWAAFVDRYGFPVRLGKYSRHAKREDIKTLKTAVRNIGRDVGAVIPDSMVIEFIDGKRSGSGSIDVFETLANWTDRQVSKGVLGQTMTTDDGASLSQAQVHNEVRLDIVESDALQLARTLQEQLIKPFVIFNFGEQEVYPKIAFPVPVPEDIGALTEAVSRMVPLGLKVSQDEIARKLGLSRPKEGEELLEPPQSPQALNSEALNRELTEPVKRKQNLDTVDELVEEAEESDFVEISDDIYEAINSVAESSKDYESFQKNLDDLLETWKIDKSAKTIGEAMFKARAHGDDEAYKE